MSLYEKFIDLGRKPSGLLGRLIGSLMNLGHRDIYSWGLANLSIEPDSMVLDIGCGGGGGVKLLAVNVSKGKIYGIDHSLDMVNLARKVNRRFIEEGRVEIDHGPVSCLPYSDGIFDIVTAFETVEFWPNLGEDLKEIKRVLKPAGMLLIVNRNPKQDSQWIEFLQLHNSGGYRDVLHAAGYIDITIDDMSQSNWILALAKKPYE